MNEEKLGRHTSDSLAPLALAARNNHTAVITLLLQFGADVRVVDRRGRTALHHAALKGHQAAVELLVENDAPLFAGDHQASHPTIQHPTAAQPSPTSPAYHIPSLS